MSNVVIQRSGNLLSIETDPELNNRLVPVLDSLLSYSHRTWFQGMDLFNRQQQKRHFPQSILRPEFEDQVRRLYETIEGKIYCSAGLKSKIIRALEVLKLSYVYEDLRRDVLPPADYSRLLDIPDLNFRYRQEEVITTIDCAEGGLINVPTGYGKTHIMTLLCKLYPRSRIACMSPGLDLIKSTYERLNSVIPGDVGRIGGGFYEPERRVILCSADSIHRLDMSKMSLIICDEVHAFATTERSIALCAQYTEAKMFGLSASLNSRADGADAILEAIFGPILLTITYGEAAEAGVVSAINTRMVSVPPAFGHPVLGTNAVSNKRLGYWQNKIRNQVIAKTCADAIKEVESEDIAEPQILVMVDTVEHVFELKRYLPDYEVVYANMSDDLRAKLLKAGLITPDEIMTPERRSELLKRFEKGKLKKVIANHCWKQGIDPIHLNIFVRADGGTSEIAGIQLPGRLSRVTNAKKEGLLIDFWDEWDNWALNRSKKRKASYKKNGFNLID